jgi:antirestriction protein ArdC
MPTVSTSTATSTWHATDRPNPATELRGRIDDHIDALARAVEDVRASDDFRRYLDVQARFHSYSWHNCMLIYMQCPDATRVAGYRAWQKLGRQVRKGERGIRILAPCPFKRERATADGDSETVQGMFFKAVSVFDLSQTDGDALPTVDVPTVETAADDLLARLARVAESRKIAVSFHAVSGGAFGLSNNGAVEIDNRHSTGQQAKTLAHELAHEALHWDIKGTFTRSLAELEAEAVAYVVCQHFGLDTEVRSSRYIALWQGDAKSMRESLERIASTARGIIDDAVKATESAEVRKAVA